MAWRVRRPIRWGRTHGLVCLRKFSPLAWVQTARAQRVCGGHSVVVAGGRESIAGQGILLPFLERPTSNPLLRIEELIDQVVSSGSEDRTWRGQSQPCCVMGRKLSMMRIETVRFVSMPPLQGSAAP